MTAQTMTAQSLVDLMIVLAIAAFVTYWLVGSWQEVPGWQASAVKTASTGLLAAVAMVAGNGHGFGLITAALALAALGDLALTRRGQAVFLAGMAAFAAGHLAYVLAFLTRTHLLGYDGISFPEGLAMLGLLALLLSTELWLAPKTGALRWPVRGYVLVIGVMASSTLLLTPHPGRAVIRVGAGLFVLSDLLLALRLFAIAPPHWRNRLSLLLWPAYWLGQALILLGALAYWGIWRG